MNLRLTPADHRQHPWRVHELAADFEVIDVWRVPLVASADAPFAPFCRLALENGFDTDSPVVRALFATRRAAGRLFGWDGPGDRAPIPGCTEYSVAERLTGEDRQRDRLEELQPLHLPVPELQPLYLFEDEALSEVANKTVHALIHLGWARQEADTRTAQVAIYIKSRGWSTRFYMGIIKPFRHWVVYPAWLKRLARLWEQQAARRPP